MCSYGASYLFVGWSRSDQIEELLSKLLKRPISLPRPTQDTTTVSFWHNEDDDALYVKQDPIDVTAFSRLQKEVIAANALYPELPDLLLGTVPLDLKMTTILRIDTALLGAEMSDGEHDLSHASLSLEAVRLSLPDVVRVESVLGVRPALNFLGTNTPR